LKTLFVGQKVYVRNLVCAVISDRGPTSFVLKDRFI